MYYVLLVLEGIVKYVFLGVIVSMGFLLGLMILLYERDRVKAILRWPILEEKFEKLCDYSDERDGTYKGKGIYESGLWVRSLIIKGAICSIGLMTIWIILIAVKN